MRATIDQRLARERAFHNDLLLDDGPRRASSFYAINERSWEFYSRALLSKCSRASARGSTDFLEYGCGGGSFSAWLLADNRFPVTGIDLSDVAVARVQSEADRRFPDADLQFRVMNAEAMDFDDDSFDVVCGNGIIHHLDLEASLREVARVLRSDGSAIFTEPLGHNPFINLYRRLTPAQRTDDEHPLLMDDLQLAGRYFGRVEARFFHLFSLASLSIRNSKRFPQALAALDRLDRAAFRLLPPARKYAWHTVLVLSEPA